MPIGIIDAPLSGLGEIEEAVKRAERNTGRKFKDAKFYIYTFNFGDQVITAGSSLEDKINIQNDADFLVRAISISARTTAVVGSSIAGTPLAAEAQPNSGVNQLPTLELIGCMFRDSDIPWFNEQVPATHFSGSGRDPGWVLVPPVLGRNNTIFATIYNNTAISIRARVSLIGAKIR